MFPGLVGAVQESGGAWSPLGAGLVVAVAAHLMVDPPAVSLPGIAGRFLPVLCVMLIENEGGDTLPISFLP